MASGPDLHCIIFAYCTRRAYDLLCVLRSPTQVGIFSAFYHEEESILILLVLLMHFTAVLTIALQE